ncbi:MAG: deoxyribodipyrimidine photo-lyase [Nitratireductor sp.]
MQKKIAIYWFRQDLRLADNPALLKALSHENVLPIFILDTANAGEHANGAVSNWWLHHSLNYLKKSLNGALSIYSGDPKELLPNLCKRFEVEAVYWNRCYEPWRIKRDQQIKENLKLQGIEATSFNANSLWEPWEIAKGDGTPYKVFTPFYRRGCLAANPPRKPVAAPDISSCANQLIKDDEASLEIEQLDLLPKINWDKKLEPFWNIGEAGAQSRFEAFINEGLNHYKGGRDFPSKPYVSRLSPHLHFGEISPNQMWYALRSQMDNMHVDTFCSQLGWREFSISLLYYNQELPVKNLQTKFDNFNWENNDSWLKAWQMGQTGVPMVDAGMRELWQTGNMHNRVRMIVGSFLVKNLRLHWHHGERWFWDTLADADMANNSASWQWIAGCGADAAPYFRVFNPVTQGKRFDPDGEYIRKYIPEIAALPDKYLFAPWETPELILKAANIELDKHYPKPIVDLKISREKALEAFKELKVPQD